MTNSQIDQPWWALRLTYGLVAFLAGLDKFFNLLTDWDKYLAPAAAGLLPMSGSSFMNVVGVIEMAVGILILTRWTRIGAYIASAWLLTIAANLVLMQAFLDLAVRDIAMAIGAWTLARLTEIRQPATTRSTASAASVQVRAEA